MMNIRVPVYAKDASVPFRAGAIGELLVRLPARPCAIDVREGRGLADDRVAVYVRNRDPAPRASDAPTANLSPVEPGEIALHFRDNDANRLLSFAHPAVLAGSISPTTAGPHFAQLMAWAVASRTCDAFESALGRPLRADGPLRLYIDASRSTNAWYDPRPHAVFFGYFEAHANAPGNLQPGSIVRTALSHDIIVHEVTHALLDRLLPDWLLPTNPDVLALHEALADLVALLLVFEHTELVGEALRSRGGEIDSEILVGLAREFGRSAHGADRPLRRATIARDDDPFSEQKPAGLTYNPWRGPHEHGNTLVYAIFGAFRMVFALKTARLRSAIGRRCDSQEVSQLLASQVQRLARHFLNWLLRALDFMPPVDPTFGDFLRAMITVDRLLYPEDPHGYRQCLVGSFRRFDVPIVHDECVDLSEESLRWKAEPGPKAPASLRTERFRYLTTDLTSHEFARSVEPASLDIAIGGATWMLDCASGQRYRIAKSPQSARRAALQDHYLERIGQHAQFRAAIADPDARQAFKAALHRRLHNPALAGTIHY